MALIKVSSLFTHFEYDQLYILQLSMGTRMWIMHDDLNTKLLVTHNRLFTQRLLRSCGRSSLWSFRSLFSNSLCSCLFLLDSLSFLWLFLISRIEAFGLSWYSPICNAALNKSAGSCWSFVKASASCSCVGHQRTESPVRIMLCLMMAMSIATLLSSHLEADETELRWSKRDLQSVTPVLCLMAPNTGTRDCNSSLSSRPSDVDALRDCRRSKLPFRASETIKDIHSPIALAMLNTWDSAPRVEDTTLGSFMDFHVKGVHGDAWFFSNSSLQNATMYPTWV